jgi:uncharacterized membrane protein YbhN (UPF0104 family)
LWFVFQRFDWVAFAAQLRTLDLRWIAAAVAADILSYVLQGARWSVLLGPAAPASLRTTTRAVYAGLFVNEVLPMRPGELVRGWIVARHTSQPFSRVLPSMVAERVIDAAVLLTAAVLSAFYIRLPEGMGEFVAAAAMVFAIGAAGVWLAAKRIPPAWLAPLRKRAALPLSSLVLLGQCLAVWCILRACGVALNPLAGMAITVVLRVGTALPLAPANAGTHQLAMLAGLALFGITGVHATGIALIVFATLTLPLLLLGAAAFGVSHVPATAYRASRPIPESS